MPGISGIRPEQICMHVQEYNLKKNELVTEEIANYSFPEKLRFSHTWFQSKKIFEILSGFYMVWSVLHYITFPLQMLTINVKHVKNLCYGMPEELLKI